MLVKRTPKPKPKITAKQVAERVGGYSPKSVLNKTGAFRNLTVYRVAPGCRPLYDPDEVDELICRMQCDEPARS